MFVCEHPECTGVHDNSAHVSEMCPAARNRRRAAKREWHRKQQLTPGACARKDCNLPKYKFSTGNYATQCAEHHRASVQKYYDSPKGMLSEVGSQARRRESKVQEKLARGFL